MLRSRETGRVRIVDSGGDGNQTSEEFNASKSSFTENYYMKWLQICCLCLTLFYDSFESLERKSNPFKAERYMKGVTRQNSTKENVFSGLLLLTIISITYRNSEGTCRFTGGFG